MILSLVSIFPGATLPYGVVKLGIDTLTKTSARSGWSTSGPVTAISAMHLSGTGGTPKYGTVSQMGLVGDLDKYNLADNATYAQNRVSRCLDMHLSTAFDPDS